MCDCKAKLEEHEKLIEQLQIEVLKLLLQVNKNEIVGIVNEREYVLKHPFGIPTIILIPICLLAWFAGWGLAGP